MLADCALLMVGAVLLYFGAGWLVGGAAGLAQALGITPLVIGLTVVSYGTSAPELAVSLVAALNDQSTIALSNVIGSNVANTGLILGLVACITPPLVDSMIFKREVMFLIAATGVLPLVLLDGRIAHVEGALLLLGATTFTYAAFRWAKHESRTAGIREEPARSSTWKLGALFLVGLAVLSAGGKVFIDGAVSLAEQLGISERVVGLTVVAFGTSLPELAASAVAASRGHSDIAVGNIVGSNLFNLLLILGATSVVHPIATPLDAVGADIAVLGVLTLFMAWSLRRERRITRTEGGIYVASYVAFLVATVCLA